MARFKPDLAMQCRLEALPEPKPEVRFEPTRRWKFDFAWPLEHLAAEVEGGTRVNGRHSRHDGYERDCEKYNHATLLGWRVLRFTTEMVNDGRAIDTLRKALEHQLPSSCQETGEPGWQRFQNYPNS
jgi:very-short-patch-repair endonuclease